MAGHGLCALKPDEALPVPAGRSGGALPVRRRARKDLVRGLVCRRYYHARLRCGLRQRRGAQAPTGPARACSCAGPRRAARHHALAEAARPHAQGRGATARGCAQSSANASTADVLRQNERFSRCARASHSRPRTAPAAACAAARYARGGAPSTGNAAASGGSSAASARAAVASAPTAMPFQAATTCRPCLCHQVGCRAPSKAGGRYATCWSTERLAAPPDRRQIGGNRNLTTPPLGSPA